MPEDIHLTGFTNAGICCTVTCVYYNPGDAAAAAAAQAIVNRLVVATRMKIGAFDCSSAETTTR